MSIPSRVLGSGVSQLSTVSICGDGKDEITATGSTRTDAKQLVSVFNSVDTVASGTGVKLPPTEMGEVIYVSNSGASALKVYPYESTSTINKTTSASVAKDHTSIFFAVNNSMWYSIVGTKT
jgi:hypothetical protein